MEIGKNKNSEIKTKEIYINLNIYEKFECFFLLEVLFISYNFLKKETKIYLNNKNLFIINYFIKNINY